MVPPNPQLIKAPDGSRHLEINLASAEEIATLPGLDVEIARRAVALRDTGGPYKSVEDFRYRLGLPVDVLVQFSSMVSTLETPAKRSGSVTPSARIVEAGGSNIADPAAAAKPRAARIVDL